MRLQDIRVVASAGTSSIGNVLAIAHEIESLLAALVESGRSGSIDLRGLPLSRADYEALREFLGQGEIDAAIEALGPTQVRETKVPGVWWVQHCNANGEVTAELIEVTYLPEILKTDPVDARAGLDRFRERLMASGGNIE
ncbi:MAG TPA: hydrogenase expression/formation C-terminal domain-containing protein [Burkholderiales bacterium]|nr:hydrogenase expression/formation C-terminal domain-containing protein [Burkholderiales bacterium]